MTVTELLSQFSNPDTIQTLSASDKMTAGLVTTILGMGITVTALVVLLFIISWMNKLLTPNTIKESQPTSPQTETATTTENAAQVHAVTDDQEIVAAITTALAMSLKTTASNIVIRNIERVEDTSPAWNRAGIVEQMNSRL
jgi:sodium pump decarboxylase gamma subunit